MKVISNPERSCEPISYYVEKCISVTEWHFINYCYKKSAFPLYPNSHQNLIW